MDHLDFLSLVGMLPFLQVNDRGEPNISAERLPGDEVKSRLLPGEHHSIDYLCEVTQGGAALHAELLSSLRKDMRSHTEGEGTPISGSLLLYEHSGKYVVKDGRHRLEILSKDYPGVPVTFTVYHLKEYDEKKVYLDRILPLSNFVNLQRASCPQLRNVALLKVLEYEYVHSITDRYHVPTADELQPALESYAGSKVNYIPDLLRVIARVWGLPTLFEVKPRGTRFLDPLGHPFSRDPETTRRWVDDLGLVQTLDESRSSSRDRLRGDWEGESEGEQGSYTKSGLRAFLGGQAVPPNKYPAADTLHELASLADHGVDERANRTQEGRRPHLNLYGEEDDRTFLKHIQLLQLNGFPVASRNDLNRILKFGYKRLLEDVERGQQKYERTLPGLEQEKYFAFFEVIRDNPCPRCHNTLSVSYDENATAALRLACSSNDHYWMAGHCYRYKPKGGE